MRGAARVWRRQCFDQIKPLQVRPGWDRFDELEANVKGWRTVSFADIPILHHRKHGERDSTARAWISEGDIAHFLGYRPSYLVFRAVHHVRREPVALAMVWGISSPAPGGGRATTTTPCGAISDVGSVGASFRAGIARSPAGAGDAPAGADTQAGERRRLHDAPAPYTLIRIVPSLPSAARPRPSHFSTKRVARSASLRLSATGMPATVPNTAEARLAIPEGTRAPTRTKPTCPDVVATTSAR